MKIKNGILLLTLWLVNLTLSAETLFQIAGQDVSTKEFEKVYQRTQQLDKGKDPKEAVQDYLDLYINYRLKLEEAKALHLDTLQILSDELKTYREQLANNYIIDKKYAEPAIKELYNHTVNEVKVSHILVRLAPDTTAEIETKAFNKIDSIRQKAINGEDFNTLAKEYSEAPSAKKDGGSIKYFSAQDNIFYAFENAAYTTPVGQISDIFKTKLGYHILKVEDRRPSKGKVQVAHIFLPKPTEKDEVTNEQVREAIKRIHTKIIKEGASFEEMAAAHSDDLNTSNKGGVLPAFGVGEMVSSFEDAAFALAKDGDISAPVETSYGWHILKRIERMPLSSFEDMKYHLQKDIINTEQGKKALTLMIQDLKKRYNVSTNQDALTEVANAYASVPGKAINPKVYTKMLFSINGQRASQQTLVDYVNSKGIMKGNIAQIVYDRYTEMIDKATLSYHQQNLEHYNKEFGDLMKEYKNGIYIFHLTQKNVWNKAIKDTTGLKTFHKTIANNYMWKERAHAVIYTCDDAISTKLVQKLAPKKNLDKVLKKVNKKGNKVHAKTLKVEKGIDKAIDATNWKLGLTEGETQNEKTTIIKIKEILPPQAKLLREVRGYAISEYQKQLEKDWIANLRAKYPVKVNQETLKALLAKQ